MEDVAVNDYHLSAAGGVTVEQAEVPLQENPNGYPSPNMVGPIFPATGFYVRHARDVQFSNVAVTC